MIAKRYAKALLELSIRENSTGPVMNEIAAVGGLMRNKKCFDFFTSRHVRAGEKLEALASLSPLTRDFLRLVIANKREEALYLISREYIGLLNDRNNVVDGTVSSGLPLTASIMKFMTIAIKVPLIVNIRSANCLRLTADGFFAVSR